MPRSRGGRTRRSILAPAIGSAAALRALEQRRDDRRRCPGGMGVSRRHQALGREHPCRRPCPRLAEPPAAVQDLPGSRPDTAAARVDAEHDPGARRDRDAGRRDLGAGPRRPLATPPPRRRHHAKSRVSGWTDELFPGRRLHRRALPRGSLRGVRRLAGARRRRLPLRAARLRVAAPARRRSSRGARRRDGARGGGRDRAGDSGFGVDVLEKRVEVPGARVSPLLLGRRHDPRESPRRCIGGGDSGPGRARHSPTPPSRS